ncbi:MAG: helix-turn-helix transcriptional regulator, partial [Gammaproteobacteria bacterium]|nr:helix-turn-helix transcriptional regulator [Gammaproteobacteria bacterium]
MSVQLIEKDGRPEYAVIPYAEYRRLIELVEEREDVHAFDTVLALDDEVIPHDVVRRLVAGEAPLKVWREYRGWTQDTLARRAGIGKSYISQIEAAKKPGSTRVLKILAEIL